jgi:membrane protease YdiL (CAAX protease family)
MALLAAACGALLVLYSALAVFVSLHLDISTLAATLIKIFLGITVFGFSGWFLRRRFRLPPLPRSRNFPGMVASAALGVAVCTLWYMLTAQFESLKPSGWRDTVLATQDIFLPMLFIWVIHAFAEELFFRGFVFERLKQLSGVKRAFVISGVFFAAAHLQGPLTSLLLFSCAVAITAAYLRYNSFLGAVMVHASINITGHCLIHWQPYLEPAAVFWLFISASGAAAFVFVLQTMVFRERRP